VFLVESHRGGDRVNDGSSFNDRRRVADDDDTVLDDANEGSSAASQDRGLYCG
jgi:hypothetical protein